MNTEHFKNYKSEDFIFDEDFREIVRKPDADARLNELIESLPEKRYEISLATKVIRGLQLPKFQQSTHRKNELWQEISKKSKKRFQLYYLKYAAAILLLIGIGTTLFLNLKKPIAEEKLVAKVTNNDDAILVLANGKTLSISSKQSTIKYSSDGTGVMVNDSSGVGQSVEGLNKMIVPYGKRSVLTLSDGTKVWLNSGSTLTFPPAFRGKTREVLLVGEAFFDVAHNKEKPFFVKTDAFKMKVYGTKFDVQAYKQDNAYSIVLVEGKVSMKATNDAKMKEVFLAPNQKATISDGGENFNIEQVDNMDNYTSWINGYLTFNNADILDLAKKISRYYKVDIDVEVTQNVENIYGKLDLKDDLGRVLEGISFISKTKYKKVGNKYVFYN
jgi:hypothetical protein